MVVRWFLCKQFRQKRCFDQTKKSYQIPTHQYVSSYLNLRYSMYIMITYCVGLEPFLLTMSSSNVFNSLIFMFRCKGITV